MNQIYKTYSDEKARTLISVLINNVKNIYTNIIKKNQGINPQGFITAYHHVCYKKDDDELLTKCFIIQVTPDKSEAWLQEKYLSVIDANFSHKSFTITKQQFEFLKEVWE